MKPRTVSLSVDPLTQTDVEVDIADAMQQNQTCLSQQQRGGRANLVPS